MSGRKSKVCDHFEMETFVRGNQRQRRLNVKLLRECFLHWTVLMRHLLPSDFSESELITLFSHSYYPLKTLMQLLMTGLGHLYKIDFMNLKNRKPSGVELFVSTLSVCRSSGSNKLHQWQKRSAEAHRSPQRTRHPSSESTFWSTLSFSHRQFGSWTVRGPCGERF